MPVFRNVQRRHSERLIKQELVCYNQDGWGPSDEAKFLADHTPSPTTTYYSGDKPSFTRPNYDEIPSQITSQTISNLSLNPLHHYSPERFHSRRQKEGHIPRPRNAFIIFRSHYYREVLGLTGQPSAEQNNVSKNAGKEWNLLSEEQKKPFEELAKLEKKEHRAKYPNYTYSPMNRDGKPKTKGMKSASKWKESERLPASKRSTQIKADQRDEPMTKPSPSPPYTPLNHTPQRKHSRKRKYAIQISTPELVVDRTDSDTSVESYTPQDASPVDTFVPTGDIPLLELPPPKEKEPTSDVEVQLPNFERIDSQFGFKPNIQPEAIYTSLPPLPYNTESDVVCMQETLQNATQAYSNHLSKSRDVIMPSDGLFQTHDNGYGILETVMVPYPTYQDLFDNVPAITIPEEEMSTMYQFFDFSAYCS